MKKLACLILVLLIAIAASGALADTCAHEEKYSVVMQFLRYQYTSIDNSQHKEEPVNRYEERCSNCGATLRSFEAVDEDNVHIGIHSYDENGYCSTCGYQCTHENTETRYEFDYNGDIQYSYEEISGDNIHHIMKRTGPCTVTVVCCGCRKTLSSEHVESAVETTMETHNYDENSVCYFCKHQNTCAHEEKYDESWISDGNPSYEEIADDDEYHYRTGKGYYVTICSICNQNLSAAIESNEVKKKETHQYYNYESNTYQDTCVACGHKCSHDWENGHCRICYMNCGHETYENGVCTVCGQVCNHVWYDNQEGRQTDTCQICGMKCAHDWENGQCRICHMSCAHEGLNEQPVQTETVTDYRNNDSRTHNIVNRTYNFRQCPTCGYKQIDWSSFKDSDPIGTEAHTYDGSGYCSVCHCMCPHEDLIPGTETKETEGPRMVRIDGRQHAMATLEVTYQTCQNCNAKVRVQEEITNIEEGTKADHNFDSYGYCFTCQSSCKHEYENGSCKYCHKVCTHSYDPSKGVCAVCGYQCTHTGAPRTYEKEYSWVNMDQHHVRNIPTLHCPTCGYSAIVPAEITEYNEAHSGSGGCSICGLSLSENIDWHYDSMHYALIITGQGPIQDYASGDDTPWAQYRNIARFIVLEKNVTGIGAYAFAGFTNPYLRVEFLQNSKPAIAPSAFEGTTAVCRYYSNHVSWTNGSDALTWVKLPLFDIQYSNMPPMLCYRDHWFIYDAKNFNAEVDITAEQGLEYTYGYRSIYLYSLPDLESDAVIQDGWDKIHGISFLGESSGTIVIDLSQDAALGQLEISQQDLHVTVNDPRPNGLMGSIMAAMGTLIYNGNVNELNLDSGYRGIIDEADVTIHGDVNNLQFYSKDTDKPFRGNLTVNGSIKSGTIYGTQALYVPGIGDIENKGMASHHIKEPISQGSPVVLDGELNLTEENQQKLDGVPNPTIDQYSARYDFSYGGVTVSLSPRDYGSGVNPTTIYADVVRAKNPNFSANDIIYADDTEVQICYGNLVFDGDNAGNGIGIVGVQAGSSVTLNCPVNHLWVSDDLWSKLDPDVTINGPVRSIIIDYPEDTKASVRLGTNGSITEGTWRRPLRATRCFENISGACDLFSEGRLNVMSRREGDTLMALLPSNAAVAEAAGQDASVELEQVGFQELKSDEQTVMNDYLASATVKEEATTVFDLSVTAYTKNESGAIMQGKKLTELDSKIPVTVSNDTEGYGYVLRLHENGGEEIEAEKLCDATSRDTITFETDKFSKYIVVRAGAKGHIHHFTYEAEGDTITVTCSDKGGCPLENGKATLKIVAPAMAETGDEESGKEATLENLKAFNDTTDLDIDPKTAIVYEGSGETSYEASSVPPTDAGDYTASITLGEATARVAYTIEKLIPEYTLPTGMTAVYGQKLSEIAFPAVNGESGTWSWEDETTVIKSIGDITFKAVFTPTDPKYAIVKGVEVTVAVSKRPVTITGLSVEDKTFDGTLDATITGESVIVYNGNTAENGSDNLENGGGSSTEDEIAGVIDGDDVTVDATNASATFENENVGEDKVVTFSGYALAGEAAGNYDLTQPATVTATIGAKSIAEATVTLKQTGAEEALAAPYHQIEYDGTEKSVSIMDVTLDETALVFDTDYTMDASSVTAATDKDTYTITINGIGNYTGSAVVQWAITGTLMQVTCENAEYTYDGAPRSINVVVTKPTAEEGYTIAYRTEAEGEYSLTENPVFTNATEEPVTVYFKVTDTNGNYEPYMGSATLKINKAVAAVGTAPAAATGLTYAPDQSQPLVQTGATEDGTLYYAMTAQDAAPADSEYTYVIPEATNAGTYYVWYKVVGDGNHTNSNPARVEARIDPKTVNEPTIAFAETTFTYNGHEKTPQVTVKDGEAVIPNTEYTVGYSENTNPGNATVTITDNAGGNYTVNGSTSFTIDKATNPAQVTATQAVEVILDGNTVDLTTYVNKGAATGDTTFVIASENALGCAIEDGVLTSGDATGNIRVTVTVAEDTYYKASEGLEIQVTVIDKLTQTVTFNETSVSKTFGDADFTIKAETDGDGQISYAVTEGSTVAAVDASGQVNILSAGSATITASATETKRYKSATASYTLTVARKSIANATVTLDTTEKGYNETQQSVAVTSVMLGGTELSAGTDYSVDDAGLTATNMGVYTVTVTGQGNYTGDAVTTWKINGKVMTVSAADVNVPYDGEGHGIAVGVTDPTEGYTITYGETADNCTLESSPTITNVIDSPKTIYYKVTASNYETVTGSAIVTITKVKAGAGTAPQAKTGLIYDGTALELVEAGSADDGTMHYAVTASNTAPETGAFEAAIPTQTNTGTYYIWYMVKGDGNHEDSDPATVPVTATISPVDKTALNNAISAAVQYYDSIKDNKDYANIAAKLKTAIDAAGTLAENDNVTSDDVSGAASTIGTAVNTAKGEVKSLDEKKAADAAAAKAAEDAIRALNDNAGVSDRAAVDEARKAYDALTPEQQKLIPADVTTKLATAEQQVQAAEAAAAKQAADQATAKAAENVIRALSSNPGINDKAAVEAARKAYDALTPEQKALVPADVTTKLATAEQSVKVAEKKAAEEAAKKAADAAAAKAAENVIRALSSNPGINDKAAVEAARKAYDALTPEQKALVPADAATKLTTAEQSVKAAEEAAAAKQAADQATAKAAEDTIRALSSSAGISDKAAVEAARKAYDALTPEQKALVPADVAAKLTTAEQSVQAAEQKAAEESAKKAADETAAKSAVDAISALSGSADISDKAAVAAARAAYDALTPEQKALVPADVVAKLTTAEQQVQEAEQKVAEETAKKAADETAAKSVVDAISALSGSAGISDKAAVEAARKAYDALTPEQKALVPADVVAKLTTAEQQVQEAEEAAKTTKISACKITVKDLTYTGKKIKKPTVTVKDGKKKLKEGTDYTISYNTKAKAIGAYKLTVTGKGSYSGSKQLTFNIIPKATNFSKLKGGKQLITLKWKNPKNITGYEIQYSLKKDFSGSKTMKIKKAKTLTTTVKKLQGGTTYYVRIRTYTTVKKKGTFYSTWSKVKTVKTKGSKKNGIDQFIEASMNVGETLDLRTMLGLPNTDMKWESGDEAVATVSEVGVVSALKSGEVVITAIVPDGEQIEVIIRISGADVLELGDVNLLDTEEMIIDEMTMDGETTEIELSME